MAQSHLTAVIRFAKDGLKRMAGNPSGVAQAIPWTTQAHPAVDAAGSGLASQGAVAPGPIRCCNQAPVPRLGALLDNWPGDPRPFPAESDRFFRY